MTSKRQNKFADLINAAREPEEAVLPSAEPVPPRTPPAELKTPSPTHQEHHDTHEQVAPTDGPRRGRPPTGKRSNPDFEQVTAYIRKNTSLATKIALLQEGNTRDFSDLVEELLTRWLRDRQ